MLDPKATPGQPTIFDVALRSGVSATTVSHVLNGTRFVAHASRQRVLAAVDELGYQPNAAARSLRSRRRRIVGLLVTNLQNRGFASLLEGTDLVMAQAGYSIIVSASRGDPETEAACVRMLREQRIDGLILAGTANGQDDLLLRLHHHGLPMVCINRVPTTLPVDHVTIDYRGAGQTLARHLLQLGHRRFAVLGGSARSASHPFMDGWCEVLADAGVAAESTTTYLGVSQEEVGFRLARTAMAVAEPPTALVTRNPPLAAGALLALQELGLDIPGQVSLATLGDGVWARVAAPPITAIQDASPDLARVAAEFLIQRIAGAFDGPPRLVTIPAQATLRRSTGPAAS
jgi:LacI family transcriptional regulator, galactose operon repressor